MMNACCPRDQVGVHVLVRVKVTKQLLLVSRAQLFLISRSCFRLLNPRFQLLLLTLQVENLLLSPNIDKHNVRTASSKLFQESLHKIVKAFESYPLP